MKLKTLNDIEEEASQETRVPVKDVLIDGQELKKEAIKWVKDDFSPEGFHARYGFNWTDSIEDWIKMFFNITEEDLK